MRPIAFRCEARLPQTPEEIAGQILDLARWPEFAGYGPLPGIKSAEFVVQILEVVGTRVRVTNRDGSTHVEEVVEWHPDRRVRLRMGEFSAPLSRLATEFVETWEFERGGNETVVIRTFELSARSVAAWPLLWLISRLLRRAVARHLRQMTNPT